MVPQHPSSHLITQHPASPAVALGSSIQIAIFAMPLAVLAGWVMGKPFALDLDPMSTLILFLSVVLTVIVTSDGRSQVRACLLLSFCVCLLLCFFGDLLLCFLDPLLCAFLPCCARGGLSWRA